MNASDERLYFSAERIDPLAPPPLKVLTADDSFIGFYHACVIVHSNIYVRPDAQQYIVWAHNADSGEVVGFVYFYIPNDLLCELFALGVDPVFRRQGFGLSLLRYGVSEAVRLGANRLVIRWSSQDADSGTLKAGFEKMMLNQYSQIRFSQNGKWTWQ